MKIKSALLALAIATASGSLFAATSDANIDGNVVITGEVVAQTCTLASGTGSDVNVTLPTVSNSLLQTAGATAGRTPFTIELSNCSAPASDGSAPTTVGVYFSPDATFDATTGTLSNQDTSGPTNVTVQLLNSDLSAINIGQVLASQNVTYPKTLVDGSISLSYYAQYYALSSVTTAGTVSAKAPFTIVYQ